jgi:NTE family protein
MPDIIASASEPAIAATARRHGQIVLVFQGGGALGAYQAGVYQALHEAGIMPDWVIGTSIGAINGAIIAGNAPADRLPRLHEFWRRVEHNPLLTAAAALPGVGPSIANWMTVTGGLKGFFSPNPSAFLNPQTPMAPEQAGYYSTAPLLENLRALIDLDTLNSKAVRLTVGAARVRTSEMVYFDSRAMALDLRHVMASGALPPAFPAVRIDGELYWDGGILSNTPVEVVFDDNPRRDGLIFTVHLWNPNGPEPDTIWSVLNRQKDLQFASRAATHVARQRQIHRMRHIVAELARRIPEPERLTPEVRAMAAYGCTTRMHVVRLLAPQLPGEDHSKDMDFSAEGIHARWDAGYAHTRRVLAAQPWEDEELDPLEGFVLHEAQAGVLVEP